LVFASPANSSFLQEAKKTAASKMLQKLNEKMVL